MVGNDLVDLEQATLDSNWRRKGYLEKVYTAAEQDLILNAAIPAVMLWLMWTMKEAAYKAENRLSHHRFYSPINFITCTNLTADGKRASGQVHYRGRIFFTNTTINTGMIHSTACLKISDLASMHTKYLFNNDMYIREFNMLYSCLHLEKNQSGLPVVIDKKTGHSYAASVSHHGQYLAVTYLDSLQLTD